MPYTEEPLCRQPNDNVWNKHWSSSLKIKAFTFIQICYKIKQNKTQIQIKEYIFQPQHKMGLIFYKYIRIFSLIISTINIC